MKVLFEKSKWYGGVITDVLERGSRIKIKYDDGDVEETGYPDEDIIIDDGEEESSLSSEEESDELYSVEDMDIDNESTTTDFQDGATTDWNVEEDDADEEEEAATSDEKPDETRLESPQRLVPLDSSASFGRGWVDGETSQEIFTQDDDAVNWSLDDISAHSSVNIGDELQEKNQSSGDDLSAISSIVSGEDNNNKVVQIVNKKAFINDEDQDSSGYVSFDVDNNSVYDPNKPDNSTTREEPGSTSTEKRLPVLDDESKFLIGELALETVNRMSAVVSDEGTIQTINEEGLLSSDSESEQLETGDSFEEDNDPFHTKPNQQPMPEHLKTLRRRVGAKKVNVQMDNDTTIGTLPAAVTHDIETKRGHNQQKDTGDESRAISILASLSASQSQKPSSKNNHQGTESALMLLASSHSGKDDMGSKDIQRAGKILTSIHKRAQAQIPEEYGE